MRKIDFDYRARESRLGATLLGVGIAAAAAMTVAYVNLAAEADQWEKASQKGTRQTVASAARAGSQGESARLQQEIDQANDVIRRLSVPWNELFKGIEDAEIDRVALLSVQPDPQRQRVNLNGEARAYADVLAYMVKLDSSGALTKARLLNHEIKHDDQQPAVAFAMTASWRIAP